MDFEGHRRFLSVNYSFFRYILQVICSYSFTVDTYKHHQSTLLLKYEQNSAVVDMSLLWLWWTSHQNDLIATRSYKRFTNETDEALIFSKKLSLPKRETHMRLNLCNGLRVVNRTVFDHYQAWKWGRDFTLNIDNRNDPSFGIPYVIASSLAVGGQHEKDIYDTEEAIQKLETQRLYLNNVHYQGGYKNVLILDVCKVLMNTGTKHINDIVVAELCEFSHIMLTMRCHPRGKLSC